MARFVNLYLLVTGSVSLLVLMMPWLVIIGLMALILPGLILGLMPTAFMWGLGFAIPWYLLRPLLGDYPAVVPALLIAAALFWFAPASSASQSKARLAQSIRPEILPPEKIRLTGHIRVDVPSLKVEKAPAGAKYDAAENAHRPYVCDALCAALLATPGVESVTINSHGDAQDGGAPLTLHARTFRVVPKAQCTAPTVRPQEADALDIQRPRPPGGIMQGLVQTFQAEWDVRLSTTDCIVAEAPRTAYDFVIRKHRYRAFADQSPRKSDWSLQPLAVSVERLDVTDRAGHLLLSKTFANTGALVQPLFIAPEGGMENFRFQWARKALTNGKRYEQFKANQLLADHTTLRTEVDRSAIIKASRDRLAQALADVSLPASDPAFKLADPWLRSLDGQALTDDDRALLAALIRDRRVTDYNGIWGAIKAMGDHAAELRGPMVDRIASLDWRTDANLKSIGRALASLPPGTFAKLNETEQTILADPERRTMAGGLISRQADRGAAAVPMLTGFLEFHLRELARPSAERYPVRPDHMVVVDQVRMAFCQMGRDASAALPAIDALAAQGLIDRRFADNRDWQLMLARIGKPIASIPKPPNLSGSENRFRRSLQQRLNRFRPDRDCRAQWS
jgi:hypothetical protein